jgi:hypothetical protein
MPEAGRSIGELSAEQRAADLADLRAGLADLAGSLTGSHGLDVLLARVATLMANAIPDAEGAGITLLKIDGGAHQVEAAAASHPFVDEIQYAAGERVERAAPSGSD